MSPSLSNSQKWHDKAQIEYFSSFLKLWLAFNALYKRLFQNDGLTTDRAHIEAVKTRGGCLEDRFRALYEGNNDEANEFKLSLFEIIKKYDGGLIGGLTINQTENVRPQMSNAPLTAISFSTFIHPRSTQLRRQPTGFVRIGKYYVKDTPDDIFPYFIEILYMVRNALVHGEMEPTDENHEIIGNMYNILNILIRDLV
jgi:hypothetical protein